MDFIVASDDCQKGKPHPEPYQRAIQKYKINNSRCLIFEDSKAGILSGQAVHPYILIGMETTYNVQELKHLGVDHSIRDFCQVSWESWTQQKKNNPFWSLSKWITKGMLHNVKHVSFDEIKLKGGFIADVIKCSMTTQDQKTHHLVFKYENKQESNLSTMAKQLQLYEREYYFYKQVAPFVPIHVPTLYNVVQDDEGNNIGILLENLQERGFCINLNLNKESIDIPVKIVDAMARMHSHFWNKTASFPELKKSTDPIFCPFLQEFMQSRYQPFKKKWHSLLQKGYEGILDKLMSNFDVLQSTLSEPPLTLIHGDIKSPNLFYDMEKAGEPWFIDWQHCAMGKGVQDLVFFVLESFDMEHLSMVFSLLKEYYYK
jgi:hypothetical protein